MSTRANKRRIDVQVFPAFRGLAKTADVGRAAAAALAVADPAGGAPVSVVVADDETLRDLNSRFRGFDEVTDVLSFGERDAPADESVPAFPEAPGEAPSLGEVVVSYPLAARQAGEHNVQVEEEVALLVAHGVLHLLGYDHAAPEDEAAMKALEVEALAAALRRRSGARPAPKPVAAQFLPEGTEGASAMADLVDKAHKARGASK